MQEYAHIVKKILKSDCRFGGGKLKINIFSGLTTRIANYRKKRKRESIIEIEEIKAGKFPFILQIIGLAVVFVVFLLIGIAIIQKINENYWIPIILSVQLIFIIIQLRLIQVQTKYFGISHRPEFIFETFKFSEGLDKPILRAIRIKNIGETAYRVSVSIKSKRKVKLAINQIYTNLYTIIPGQVKDAVEINNDDYENKRVIIKLEYYDKIGNYNSARFLKVEGEEDFIPLFTGLE